MQKIAIKLIVILGVCEIFGLVQIPKSELTKGELIFNVIFRMIYVLTRSFRGFLICIVYLMNKKTSKMFKDAHQSTQGKENEMTSFTKQTTVES